MESTAFYYVGIDIGATAVKVGLVGGDGNLLARKEFETSGISGPDHFIDVSQGVVLHLVQSESIPMNSVSGIGVGVPGWVNHDAGIVHDLTNIPHWTNVRLAEQLEQAIGPRTFVDNDANVMAMGELIHGAGQGRRAFICLTLGTGVGGAIVMDGKLYRGVHGLAGEIGHMILDIDGPSCACGSAGCLERFVGNRFIVADALQRLERDENEQKGSLLREMAGPGPNAITPQLLAEAALKGDEIALEIWNETGRRIGAALAVLINLLNPECFIIGGGVANAGAVLFDPLRRTMESQAMNGLGKATPVLKAQLGDYAGVIGAATLAMTCIKEHQSPSL